MESDLKRLSPFKLVDDTIYNLDNTTPDLLKFQLQEAYRQKLFQLKLGHHSNLNVLNSQFLDHSFNNHLQSQLDQDLIMVEDGENIVAENSEDMEEIDVDNEINKIDFISHSESLPSLQSDDSLDYLSGSAKNYINLRILIENSIFDSKKITKNSILSLNNLKILKNLLNQKFRHLNYLKKKSNLTNELLNDMILQNLDLPIQNKLLKSSYNLSNSLLKVTSEVNTLKHRLNNHNFACLILGYVEDVNFSQNNQNITDNDNLDSLVSKIINLSIKKNISLPQPSDDKIKWLESCLDKLIENSHNEDDNSSNLQLSQNLQVIASDSLLNFSLDKSMKKTTSSSQLSSLQTALNDLRFSHQYLIKEYEHSRTSSQKLINEYRKKISHLEDELNNTSINKNKTTNVIDYDSLDLKDREISKLKKDLNNLKIDKIGSKSNISTNYESFNTSGFNLDQSPDFNDDDDSNSSSSNLSVSRNGMSNGILRKEFKKIVGEIQDQYEVELNEERIRRRKLEQELNTLREQELTKEK